MVNANNNETGYAPFYNRHLFADAVFAAYHNDYRLDYSSLSAINLFFVTIQQGVGCAVVSTRSDWRSAG